MNKKIENSILSSEILASVGNLELIANMVVEGFLTGLHQSPFHGFSVEFSQHRPYMDGDNLRFVDWKVFGRTNRYYIKQFEEETNLQCHILFDVSKSMLFGEKPVSKFVYGLWLTSAISFLMLKQRDAVGLHLFDSEIRKSMPPKSAMNYHKEIIEQLQVIQPGNDTSVSSVLHKMAEHIKKRSMIILISDLLDDPDAVIAGLKHFRYNQNEVIVFQVLDENEREFNYSGDIVFEDMESGNLVKTHSKFIRDEYKTLFENFLNQYQVEMNNNQISYKPIFTNRPLNEALNEYLIYRTKLS
jgi:uncharacterized protein (DUF58 family)